MEQFPNPKKISQIPDAEKVDLDSSPVTREEMLAAKKAAVEALKEEAINEKNEEFKRLMHTENPTDDSPHD